MPFVFESPRIATLRNALASGQTEALTAFWDEMTAQHTPLLEPIPDDNTRLLATFLWRGDQDTKHVNLFTAAVGYMDDLSVNRMRHLDGSDVWYMSTSVRRDLRTAYYFCPDDPLPSLSSLTTGSEYMNWAATYWHTDPLNATSYVFAGDDETPGDREVTVSVFCGPDAVAQPYTTERPKLPKGRVVLHRFASQKMNNKRRVWLYTPPGYQTDGEPYAWLLVFDGFAYMTLVPTPVILDNMLAEGVIPPLVAVMVNSEGETRNNELPCNADFAAFIADELVPWLHTQVNITNDPKRSVVAGSSYGGLAATWLGFTHPELFGNVLSQSGSYQWVHPGDPEPGWLTRQFVSADRLPLWFYLDTGLLETSAIGNDGISLLGAVRHFRDVLKAKDYPVTYAEFSGGHEYLWWQKTLADGLIALLSGPQRSTPKSL